MVNIESTFSVMSEPRFCFGGDRRLNLEGEMHGLLTCFNV